MKFNKWTLGLAAVGAVSLASAARADETQMSQVQTALSSTTLSGYVDVSAMWQLGSQNGGPSAPYTPGGVTGDGFNLNSVDIALDKPMDESPWASGYHVEMMLGADAVTPNSPAVRQAYLSLRTPIGNSGIDWKVGVFDTIIGYESSSDPLDPNYTRSYGWGVEPTTHTGILGTYKVSDAFSVSAGVANTGFGAGAGNASNGPFAAGGETQKTYMGAVAFTAPDSMGWMKGATLNAGIINSDVGSGGGATWYYLGATLPTPSAKVKVGAAFDYVDFHNGSAAAGNPSDDSVWVAGLYASIQANDKLSFNARGEFLDATSVGGHTGEELTGTIQYNLWANVLSRVELRWDHNTAPSFDSSPSAPGVAIHKNAVLLALNLIYQF